MNIYTARELRWLELEQGTGVRPGGRRTRRRVNATLLDYWNNMSNQSGNKWPGQGGGGDECARVRRSVHYEQPVSGTCLRELALHDVTLV